MKELPQDWPPGSAALHYGREGLPIFPVDWEKRPLVRHGYRDATADLVQIRRWWTRWPLALIGMPTGAGSGLLAIDIDVKHGEDGEREWNALMIRFGVGETPTRNHLTPSGGRHLIYRMPDGDAIRNSAGRIAPGVDVRGDGGSIVLPGSRNESGVYELLADIPAAPLPEWLAVLLRLTPLIPKPPKAPRRLAAAPGDRARQWALAALEAECQAVARAANGTRNDQLNRAAYAIGQIVGGGALAESEAAEHLWAAAQACGLSAFEASGTIRSGMRAGQASPRYPAEDSDAR